MLRSAYDDYIRRFNEEDPTAFDEYIHPDMRMLNGALEFRGVDGMRDHYENKIWPHFVETLNILRYVSDESTLAVRMWTTFTAKHDGETLFGRVVEGERFDFRGVIMYEIEDGRFSSITVAYNSFSRTTLDGTVSELGLPH